MYGSYSNAPWTRQNASAGLSAKPILVLGLVMLLAAITAPDVFSQATEGSILGTITDPSGSAIGGALVNVKSLQTGFVRSSVTNQSGEYVVSNLPPGSYSVSAEKAGFKKAVYPAAESAREHTMPVRVDRSALLVPPALFRSGREARACGDGAYPLSHGGLERREVVLAGERDGVVRGVRRLVNFMNLTYPVLLDDGAAIKALRRPRSAESNATSGAKCFSRSHAVSAVAPTLHSTTPSARTNSTQGTSASARPTPQPPAFVLMPGSKMQSRTAAAIPGPSSAIRTPSR